MFVPLVHPPGHAQADFGEAIGIIGGVERKIHFFAFDLPHSDACFVVGYPAETTEAFCDGHVRAFAFFGGVPNASPVMSSMENAGSCASNACHSEGCERPARSSHRSVPMRQGSGSGGQLLGGAAFRFRELIVVSLRAIRVSHGERSQGIIEGAALPHIPSEHSRIGRARVRARERASA
jgi:hypothetical protein